MNTTDIALIKATLFFQLKNIKEQNRILKTLKMLKNMNLMLIII